MEMYTNEPTGVRLAIGIIFFGLIAVEAIWSYRLGRGVYDWKETLANFGVLLGTQVSKVVFLGYQMVVLGWFAQFRIAEWSGGVAAFLATFVLIDFLYYWQHRIMHEVKFFWAFHLVHHSAQKMNLTTSFRLNWVSPLIVVFFFVPAAVLGAPVSYIIATIAINLVYQFWLHTTAIGKLGWLEGVVNTPSAHRVHHGSNPEYLDRNYGAVFMIWDRMFGTYAPESVPVRYGVTTGPVGYNPFVLVFQGFVDFFRGRLESRG